jgi:DNA-binding beta-propeller fold protein YncE
MKTAILTITAALAAFGQSGIRGPAPGIVFDPEAKALRPMVGIPGASYLGGKILDGLEAASVSPDGTLALAVKEGRLGRLDMRTPELNWTELAPADGALLIVWNQAGTMAAVRNGNGRIDLWRGLDGAPQGVALGEVENVSALAVDADGVVAAGSANALFRLKEGAAPELLAALDAAALALDAKGATLYAAGATRNAVVELSDWRNSGAATLLASGNLGVDQPSALAVSADGRKLIVANGGEAPGLLILDLATRAVAGTLALEFKPTRLDRLSDGVSFVLNSRQQGQPLEVLSGAPGAKVFFVPVEE